MEVLNKIYGAMFSNSKHEYDRVLFLFPRFSLWANDKNKRVAMLWVRIVSFRRKRDTCLVQKNFFLRFH